MVIIDEPLVMYQKFEVQKEDCKMNLESFYKFRKRFLFIVVYLYYLSYY